jgi:hypothetical protein
MLFHVLLKGWMIFVNLFTEVNPTGKGHSMIRMSGFEAISPPPARGCKHNAQMRYQHLQKVWLNV